MVAELPAETDYRRLVTSGAVLRGSLRPERLTRAASPVLRVTGDSTAELRCARREDGTVVVSGTFSTPVAAQCQRCLAWLDLVVTGEFALVVREEEPVAPAGGTADEAAGQSEDDHVLAPAGRLAVHELIEDELILACPMIPRHADNVCGAAAGRDVPGERHKPFAALGELLAARDKSERTDSSE